MLTVIVVSWLLMVDCGWLVVVGWLWLLLVGSWWLVILCERSFHPSFLPPSPSAPYCPPVAAQTHMPEAELVATMELLHLLTPPSSPPALQAGCIAVQTHLPEAEPAATMELLHLLAVRMGCSITRELAVDVATLLVPR